MCHATPIGVYVMRRCSCGLGTDSDELWEYHVALHEIDGTTHRELSPSELFPGRWADHVAC